MKIYQCPAPLEVAERARFDYRVQQPQESIAQFNVALHAMLQHCNFGDQLTTRLRDRLVSGIRSESIRKSLYVMKNNLTYEKALESALELATSEVGNFPAAQLQTHFTAPKQQLQQQQQFKLSNNTQGRHKRSSKPYNSSTSTRNMGTTRNTHNLSNASTSTRNMGTTRNTQYACLSCGSSTHLRPQCPHKDATCNGCGKHGHIKPVCMSGGAKSAHRVKTVQMQEDLSFYNIRCSDVPVNNVTFTRTKSMMLTVNIANVSLPIEIDTGAAATIIFKQCFNAHFSSFHLEKIPMKVSAYDGHALPMAGVCVVPVKFELPLCVARIGAVPLLGRDWLSHFGLLDDFATCADVDIHAIQPSASAIATSADTSSKALANLLAKHAHVFRDEIRCSKFLWTTVHIDIDSSINPIFLKAYPVPIAIKELVEAELRRLQSLGIISPVAASRWATPIMRLPSCMLRKVTAAAQLTHSRTHFERDSLSAKGVY
uniref:CCHC-type domain-containing protein n=1 Tax=Strigamia maritima TaxID=126957 RepID=T1IK34_STRMM